MDDGSKAYGKGLARAAGGALIFSLPLLMTMEMWWLGFTMDPARQFLFLSLSLPMLLGLSYFAGFEETFSLRDELLDALAAFGVGFLLSAAMLALFGVLKQDMSPDEMVRKVVLSTVPASIGALLAGKQFSDRPPGKDREQKQAGFLGQVFLMGVGAVFLAFNVAPTEEMALISYQMTPVHALLVIGASILVLHLMVFELGFPGDNRRKGDSTAIQTFLTRTAPGYGIALAISFYMLWSFGRLDATGGYETAAMVVVLAFPAALGAASARLVI